ncbi:hypothetical protein ABTD45_19730, partial [Acinetobacter baumannii]
SHINDIRHGYTAGDFRVHRVDLHSFELSVILAKFNKFDSFLAENLFLYHFFFIFLPNSD